MAKKAYEETNISAIGSAIKTLVGGTGGYTTSEMASAITTNLQKKATGSQSITSNGTYDVTAKAEVVVNVSGGGSPTLQNKNIAVNGTYTADQGYDGLGTVTVAVPNPSTGSLSISANGTYDVTNYASAVVNVSGGGGLPTGWIMGEVTFATDTNVVTFTHNLNSTKYFFIVINTAEDMTTGRIYEFMALRWSATGLLTQATGGNSSSFTNLAVTNAYAVSATDNAVELDGTDKSQFRPFNGTYKWIAIPYT